MSNLNLARKLRPKNFSEIIGQELSVSMLKNSLFVKKLFPVYLFSGQRGCGKTSTARVFGAAINCHNLSDFQANAQDNSVPCLTCESCQSMIESNHPDFIEMDAASHTGVDNIRQIIESCTYMPLSGSKKIYLIDEAHMLSRAAFNAFLKILEEPPASTIFILATTEIQKIPDTVRSRCFQVIFNPVHNNPLFVHLKKICQSEQIDADDDALRLLINENDGSVRDAINTLEQVRFAGEKISTELVLKSLGKISDTKLCAIFDTILDQSPKELLKQLQEIQFETLSAQSLWSMTVGLLRQLVWIKYGVKPSTNQDNESLKKLAEKCSINKLHALLQIIWSQEGLFLQTPQKHLFLETVLLSMCRQVNISNLRELIDSSRQNQVPFLQPKQTSHQTQQSTAQSHTQTQTPQDNSEKRPWTAFVNELQEATNDPVLLSIFKQAVFISAKNSEIKIKLSTSSPFLKEKIDDSETIWKSILTKHFPDFTSFTILEEKAVTTPRAPVLNSKQSAHPSLTTVDITDTKKWPQATLLTKAFSGRLEKTSEKP
ncbi:DNA polymerase III subunit gamma/tau [Candidatus Dependentiae bacterium]|nr:DNA polymerase III subunit gamma/tau [Candidatus Dependentiae bacterium]